MKRFYIIPCVGACALLLFPSCRSTDGDGYSESALPMSEVADGEIPPWLLEDDGSHGAQIAAGTHTPTVASRNDYSIPEPTESSRGSRQNQPALTQDDTLVESSGSAAGTDPMAVAAHVPHPTDSYTEQPVSTPKPKSSGTKKSGSKPQKPTMIVYKVRPGDNLSLIAARSNTTVAQIRKDSNLKSSTIYPGQTIKVRYTPKGYKPGKSGSAKGSASSKGSGATHTVSSGQTLSGIAAKYGVSTAALMKANGLSAADAKKIRPGQKLKIPAKR